MALTGTAAQNSLSVLRVHPTEPDGSQGVVSPEKHPGRGEGIVRKRKGLGKDKSKPQALVGKLRVSRYPKIPTLGAAGSYIPPLRCHQALHPLLRGQVHPWIVTRVCPARDSFPEAGR